MKTVNVMVEISVPIIRNEKACPKPIRLPINKYIESKFWETCLNIDSSLFFHFLIYNNIIVSQVFHALTAVAQT